MRQIWICGEFFEGICPSILIYSYVTKPFRDQPVWPSSRFAAFGVAGASTLVDLDVKPWAGTSNL